MILLQSLVTAVGGQQTAVVTVISTLLIAACSLRCAGVSRMTSTGVSSARNMMQRKLWLHSAPPYARRWIGALQSQIVAVVEETCSPSRSPCGW